MEVELENSKVYVNDNKNIIAVFELRKSLFGKVKLKVFQLCRFDKLDAIMTSIKEAEKALNKINKYL